MNHRVLRKQQNSSMCLVCGLDNPLGLRAAFFELETGQVVALCTPGENHQGYPDRLHGGIAAALLDETIGRAVMLGSQETVWGVTVEFKLRFRKPVPLGVQLRVVGRITRSEGRLFEGTGELLLPDGEAAVTAGGRYLRQPLSRIADVDHERLPWAVVSLPTDPAELSLP